MFGLPWHLGQQKLRPSCQNSVLKTIVHVLDWSTTIYCPLLIITQTNKVCTYVCIPILLNEVQTYICAYDITKKFSTNIFRKNFSQIEKIWILKILKHLRNYLRNSRPQISNYLRNSRPQPKNGVSYKKKRVFEGAGLFKALLYFFNKCSRYNWYNFLHSSIEKIRPNFR